MITMPDTGGIPTAARACPVVILSEDFATGRQIGLPSVRTAHVCCLSSRREVHRLLAEGQRASRASHHHDLF